MFEMIERTNLTDQTAMVQKSLEKGEFIASTAKRFADLGHVRKKWPHFKVMSD